MLFWFSHFFYDPMDISNLMSGSSAFSKSSLNIWKFIVHVLLKPGLENFEHYFSNVRLVQLCGSLSILWHCLSLGLEWKLTFSSPMATAEFSKFAGILSVALSQHHLLAWRLSNEELMLLYCGAGEDFWESLGQQWDQPVNPKGNQPWIFIGRTDAEPEAPTLWPPDAKSRLTGKDLDAGKDRR